MPGCTAAILGVGGVGLSVLLGATAAGASRTIVVDVDDEKLRHAASLGATDVVRPRDGDVVEQLRELTDGGVDYAFEAIGNVEAMAQAVAALRPAGTAVIIGGAPEGSAVTLDARALVLHEQTVKGSIFGSVRPGADFGRLFDLYRRGTLPIDRLLAARYPLARINDAYDALLAGQLGRSLVLPGLPAG